MIRARVDQVSGGREVVIVVPGREQATAHVVPMAEAAVLRDELTAAIDEVRGVDGAAAAALAAYAEGFATGADCRSRVTNLDPAVMTHWDRGRYDGAAAAKKALDAYPERMRWEAEVARRSREDGRG
jgi:hypothetical protein